MNGFSAADMSTAAANGYADGYQTGYADAVKAVEAGKPAAAQEAGYIEFLDAQNHSLRRAIHAIMKKLAFLLDEDQFADIDSIALAAGAAPVAAAPEAVALRTAMTTLEQIASTPRNKGARMNAKATLLFLQTQLAARP